MSKILIPAMPYPCVLLLKIFVMHPFLGILIFPHQPKTVILFIFMLEIKKEVQKCFSLLALRSVLVGYWEPQPPNLQTRLLFHSSHFPLRSDVHHFSYNSAVTAFDLRTEPRFLKWTSKDSAFLFSLFSLVSSLVWPMQLQDESIKFLNSSNLLIYSKQKYSS